MLLAASIEVVSRDLKLITHMPKAVAGVVPFINQFTRLWIGTVQPDLFKRTFNEIKTQVLPWIADLALLEDNLDYRIGHKLELCHTALKSRWNSPATATITDHRDIFWESGQSRFLAGGLCWAMPWEKHQLLAFAPDLLAVEPWMKDPVEIINDTELSNYLGPNISNVINTRFDVDNQKISFRLSSVAQHQSRNTNETHLESRVETLRQWIKLYPRGTRLDVYTQNPELIKDSIGYWDINYLTEQPVDVGCNYVFYVRDCEHMLDVSELLFWMDTEYTKFVTSDGKCTLKSPGTNNQSKLIGLSCL
jgi:hypothetical protein